MRTGCESSRKFLEVQVFSSSLDGWTVARRPAGPVAWMELCFNHPVVCCSPSLPYYSHVPPLPVLFVYRMSLVWRRQPAIYASEQVCIQWHRTGACYTDKLTFSHSSSIKVWGAYYTNVRIIFEFLRYFCTSLQVSQTYLCVVRHYIFT